MGGMDRGHPWPRLSLCEGACGVRNRFLRFREPPSVVQIRHINETRKWPHEGPFSCLVVMGTIEVST